jgi:segregation and condensation protein B
MENTKAILEALIFASEFPLSIDKIGNALQETEKTELVRMLNDLVKEYEERRGGICLQAVAGGFQFRTRQEFSPWIKKLRTTKYSILTPAAIETVAIIAYKQPVMKSEIDKIRGVDTGGTLKSLLEKKMIRIVGRKDIPGKPLIYGTTKKFLETFNLKDLSELPTLREWKDLQQDKQM